MTTPTPKIVRATYNSPLGPMTLAASAQGLCGVWFDGQQHQPDPQQWEMNTAHPVLQAACSQLTAYFAAQAARFSLQLDVSLARPFSKACGDGCARFPMV